MNLHLRIPASILVQVYADLRRPHSHAAERVGFLFARPEVLAGESSLGFAVDFWPVPDDGYLQDSSVGAKISDSSIRAAMQKAYDSQNSAFHVHLHDWNGQPMFSRTDSDESARLMRCFASVAPGLPHGAIIISKDGMCGRYWKSAIDKLTGLAIARITVVGFPMKMYGA